MTESLFLRGIQNTASTRVYFINSTHNVLYKCQSIITVVACVNCFPSSVHSVANYSLAEDNCQRSSIRVGYRADERGMQSGSLIPSPWRHACFIKSSEKWRSHKMWRCLYIGFVVWYYKRMSVLKLYANFIYIRFNFIFRVCRALRKRWTG